MPWTWERLPRKDKRVARWLLEQDWVSRHIAWRELKQRPRYRFTVARLAAVLASDQLLDGKGGPTHLWYGSVVSLPRPPERWAQTTLHRYFSITKVKRKKIQLTLDSFWRRTHE